jgi:hypothetical protein
MPLRGGGTVYDLGYRRWLWLSLGCSNFRPWTLDLQLLDLGLGLGLGVRFGSFTVE